MHLDERPSCPDPGPEKTNTFAPQYSDITRGWALWVSFYHSGPRPMPRSVLQAKRGPHFSVKAGPEAACSCGEALRGHPHPAQVQPAREGCPGCEGASKLTPP